MRLSRQVNKKEEEWHWNGEEVEKEKKRVSKETGKLGKGWKRKLQNEEKKMKIKACGRYKREKERKEEEESGI